VPDYRGLAARLHLLRCTAAEMDAAWVNDQYLSKKVCWWEWWGCAGGGGEGGGAVSGGGGRGFDAIRAWWGMDAAWVNDQYLFKKVCWL
jgi:hypothetical protein